MVLSKSSQIVKHIPGRFEAVAEVYRIVSEDSLLGHELPDARVRGKTVEDVVALVSDGIDKKALSS